MKKLLMLLVLVLMTLKGISQTDTAKKILPKPINSNEELCLPDYIARAAALDLVEYDACKLLLKNKEGQLTLYKNESALKDKSIAEYRKIIKNDSNINKAQVDLLGIANNNAAIWESKFKVVKTKSTIIYSIGSAIIAGLVYLLITK